jgi:hypothetical protein
MSNDTIVAIATAPGRGGIGVVQTFGPDLSPFMLALIGKDLTPRHAPVMSLSGRRRDRAGRWHCAVFSRPAFVYRRTCPRIAGAWRSAGAATGCSSAVCNWVRAGATGRIQPSRVSQRQAGSGPGGSDCRSDRCRQPRSGAFRAAYPGRRVFTQDQRHCVMA